MFKTDSFLGNKKLSLNQNVWHDHATMQQDVLLHFWVIFDTEMRPKYEEVILLSSSRVFLLSTPIENSEASWKKASNGLTTQIEFIFCVYYLSQCEFLPKTENCNSCGLSISISGTIRGVVFWTLRHFKGKFCLLKNSSTV